MENLYRIDPSGTSFKKRLQSNIIDMNPFPHVTLENVFTPKAYKTLLSIWPNRDTMTYDASSDKWWFNLLSDRIHKKPWFDFRRDKESKQFRKFVIKDLMPIIRNTASILFPYYAKRFDTPIQLFPKNITLHESGPNSKSLNPHVHFIHNPEYAFTIFIYVEDDGYTHRGTTLFKPEVSKSEVANMLNVTNGHSQRIPVKNISFLPNKALIFVDSPFSIYGGMNYETLPVKATCKMLICHMAGVTSSLKQKNYIPTHYQNQMTKWRETCDMTSLDAQTIDWFAAEKAVLESWRV